MSNSTETVNGQKFTKVQLRQTTNPGTPGRRSESGKTTTMFSGAQLTHDETKVTRNDEDETADSAAAAFCRCPTTK